MVKVENLTKRYGDITAVDGISFEVQKGEILGFLGPNGAGKTTTMRILTGYMPATSGTALVAGYDVFKQSLEVRKRIGYLPEHPPLYHEMVVEDYLRYVAKLKQTPRAKREETVESVIGKCSLGDVRSRIIGNLSKGYKQRVGLAQALINDPEVLILDEPTIGLDPLQIRQIRDLIKSLARKHTIILSTHILPEVTMTCDKVVIINRGKVVAADTIENLSKAAGAEKHILVRLDKPYDAVADKLKVVPGVSEVRSSSDPAGYRVLAEGREDEAAKAIFEAAERNGWGLVELSRQTPSLEEVFVRLTSM